jgi:virulence factor
MDKVKVGMIGAGGRARYAHYPSLAEMCDVEMAAVCELKEDLLKTTAEKYGIKERFTDYKQMLKKVDLDAVYIIMNPSLLDPLVTYCLKQNKNIFVEKPPGTVPEETRKWAKLAQENNCKTMVGFQRRFHPCYKEAKKIVEERGKILYCMAAFHKHGEWQKYGDSLTYDVIHVVDLLRDMGGNVKKVRSLSGQLYNDIEGHLNFYTATLEFESGGVGLLNSNRTSGGRALYFEMHAKGISAYGNIPGIRGIDHYIILKDNQPYQEAEIVKNEQLIGSDAPLTHIDGSFQANRHFMDCIKEDRQPLTNFGDATKTMEAIDEILSGPQLPPII